MKKSNPTGDRSGNKQANSASSVVAEFHDSYNHLPFTCFLLDKRGKIISLNTAGVSQLGYQAEELKNIPVSALIYWPKITKKHQLTRWLSSCIKKSSSSAVANRRGEQPFAPTEDYLGQIRAKTGQIFWFKTIPIAVNLSLKENAKKTTANICLICQDVTNFFARQQPSETDVIKETFLPGIIESENLPENPPENLPKKSAENLPKNLPEGRAEISVNSSLEELPEMIAIFDKDLRCIYANLAFVTALKIEVGQVISQTTSQTNQQLDMPDDLVKFWEQKLHEVWQTKAPIQDSFLSPVVERRNGVATIAYHQWYEVCWLPLWGSSNSVEWVFTVARKISHAPVKAGNYSCKYRQKNIEKNLHISGKLLDNLLLNYFPKTLNIYPKNLWLSLQILNRKIKKEIADKLKIEAALEENQERLNLLINTNADGIIILDGQGKILFVNPAAAAIFGRHKKDLIGVWLGRPIVTHEMTELEILRPNGKVAIAQMQVVEIPWSQAAIQDFGASSPGNGVAYLGSLRDVTDQKLTSDRLLWMQQAIESASDAIAITNRTGRVIYQNPAFCQLFEYQDVEEINQLNPAPNTEVFTPNNYPKFLSNFLRHSPLISGLFIEQKLAEEVLFVVRNGQSWQGEVMMRSRTGQVMQIALKADAIESYPGHIVGLICTYTDVTERRLGEEMLRISLAQNQAILKTIPDTLFRIRADGTYLDCHQGIGKQLHKNYQEYIGQKCQDILPPFLAKELMAAIEQALVTKKVQVFEYQLVLPGENGQHRLYDYEARVSAIDDHEVLTMVRDVSAKAEAQRSLRESEQRYRTLTETSQDMIFIFNRDASINYVNTYAAHQLNSSPEQLIGQSVQDIFPRTFATELASKIYQVLRDKQLCTLEQQLGAAHEPAWWHFSLVPLRNETGILTTVLAVARNITERIKAEAALQQSQEKLRQSQQQLIRTLATAPIGITTCDLNGEFKSVNPALCQMLGYFALDLQKMSLADLVHPSDRSRLKSWIATFPASKLSQSQKEYTLIRQDGSEMIATIRVALVRDAAEKPLELVATIEDITDRLRSQEQLLLLSKAVESASDAIAITDPDGRSTYHNPAFIELFGYSAPDLAAVGGPSVLYRDASVAASVFDAIFRAGSWQGEVEMLSTQGVIRQIFLRTDAIQDATGEIIALLGVYRDITERKQAIDALAESEERFRTLADTAPVLIWLADPHGNYTFFNQTWLEFTGRTMEQEQGQGWMSQIHPDDFQHCLREYLNAVERSESFRLLYRLRRKDGEYRWLLNTGVPSKTPAGNLAGYIGSCIDISDRKKLEEELAERAKQLEQSNAELEQFAYVASHDLQEPLRTIASYTQLLAKRYQGQLDEKADKYIHYIVDGAQRMQALIDDLLKYSRVSTSRQEFQPVDCQEILEQAIGHLKVAIRQAGAEVSLDPTCPRLPVVLGDATQLLQLFQNLISNAIKYRQPEVKPVVKIAAKPSQFKNSGGCWLFAVKDNGIGIDPQHRDRIFLIFQRLHTRNEYPGTGIGLAVCHKIVERHQGQIWVESQIGQGATFYFTLPQV